MAARGCIIDRDAGGIFFTGCLIVCPCVKALDVRKMVSPTEILIFSICFHMTSLEPFSWPAGTTSELKKYRWSRLSMACIKGYTKNGPGLPGYIYTVYIYIYMYIYICIEIYVCIYKYISYIYMRIYIFIYIYSKYIILNYGYPQICINGFSMIDCPAIEVPQF